MSASDEDAGWVPIAAGVAAAVIGIGIAANGFIDLVRADGFDVAAFTWCVAGSLLAATSPGIAVIAAVIDWKVRNR